MGRGVYPGYGTGGDRVGAGEGYTGYPARLLQDPIFSIFKAKASTHGQMKGILRYFMRFLRMGLRLTSE